MTQSVDELLLDKIVDGDAYIISEMVEGLASGGDFRLHVENPADSGYGLLIYTGDAESKEEASVHVHDEFDSISSGTEIEPHSSLSGANGAPFNAYEGSSYTATNTHDHSVIGSGGGSGNATGGNAGSTLLMVQQGHDAVFHLHNDSSNASDVTIKIVVLLINRQ